jgi:aminoglycoside phosphotransferase (APT) family kinase protein
VVDGGIYDDMRRARLCGWLDANVPTLGDGPIRFSALSGGSSNDVFCVSRSAGTAVLRSPRLTDERMIDREARVLAALAGTDIPHARLLGYCEDSSILGHRFIVTSWVQGTAGSHLMKQAEDLAPDEARELSLAVVHAAAGLAQLNYSAAGLADFGKPERFLERQVARWLAMLESYKARPHHVSRPIPGLDVVSGWLPENTPPAGEPALIHGDIGFSNAMFSTERPRRLVALLDWETATIGDPLLDLGRAILPMRGEGRPHWPTQLHDYRHFPTREELARAYASTTGRSVEHLDYYVVLAHFKLAVILERHYATVAAGQDADGQSGMLARYALELMARAEAITQKQA